MVKVGLSKLRFSPALFEKIPSFVCLVFKIGWYYCLLVQLKNISVNGLRVFSTGKAICPQKLK